MGYLISSRLNALMRLNKGVRTFDCGPIPAKVRAVSLEIIKEDPILSRLSNYRSIIEQFIVDIGLSTCPWLFNARYNRIILDAAFPLLTRNTHRINCLVIFFVVSTNFDPKIEKSRKKSPSSKWRVSIVSLTTPLSHTR